MELPDSPDAGANDKLWCFDTASKTWSVVAGSGQPPAPRSYHAMTAAGESFYVFGGCGEGQTGRLNDLHEFNTVTKTWTQLPSDDAIKVRARGRWPNACMAEASAKYRRARVLWCLSVCVFSSVRPWVRPSVDLPDHAHDAGARRRGASCDRRRLRALRRLRVCRLRAGRLPPLRRGRAGLEPGGPGRRQDASAKCVRHRRARVLYLRRRKPPGAYSFIPSIHQLCTRAPPAASQTTWCLRVHPVYPSVRLFVHPPTSACSHCVWNEAS
jgi:Galactose oxidase, central domain